MHGIASLITVDYSSLKSKWLHIIDIVWPIKTKLGTWTFVICVVQMILSLLVRVMNIFIIAYILVTMR